MKKYLFAVIAFVLAATIAVTPVTASTQSALYIVKPGDTMWKISQKAQVDLNQLFQWNRHIADFNVIRPYQIIFIPYVPAKSEAPTPAPKPTEPKPNVPAPTPQPDQDVPAGHAWEQEVVDLVNAERAKAGLSPLKMDWELSKVARDKSKDMRDRGYFSHTSPTYGSPFDMMNQYGIQYRSAGENIAAGQRSPAEVVKAWMDSPGHRQNIMSTNYTHIGVGLAEGGSYGYYWTQMFIGK